MSSPRLVRVSGPLAPFAVGFEEDMVCQGCRSAGDHLYVMAQLSCWMAARSWARRTCRRPGIEEFVCWRQASGYVSPVSSVSRLVLAAETANLLELCRAHHRLLPEGGYRVETVAPGHYAFYRPDGSLLDTPTVAVEPGDEVSTDVRSPGVGRMTMLRERDPSVPPTSA